MQCVFFTVATSVAATSSSMALRDGGTMAVRDGDIERLGRTCQSIFCSISAGILYKCLSIGAGRMLRYTPIVS
jgi:hypothetical protein